MFVLFDVSAFVCAWLMIGFLPFASGGFVYGGERASVRLFKVIVCCFVVLVVTRYELWSSLWCSIRFVLLFDILVVASVLLRFA